MKQETLKIVMTIILFLIAASIVFSLVIPYITSSLSGSAGAIFG